MAELSSPAAVFEIGTVTPWVRKASSAWVRGPVWDGFWMLSALWLAPIVLLLVQGYSNPESSPLDLLYFGLTALFWIGHRLSSSYLAYCTEAYRPLLRGQPIRFIALPLLVTAGCFALFLPADSALPWTREERLIGLAIIDYACVTYHFAAQHFGALSLYRSRADRGPCIQTRRWDRFFALTAGGVLVFVADILAGAVAYQDQWVDRWFPAWIVSAENGIRGAAALALFAITAIMLVIELRMPRWSLPRVLYIIGLAVMVGLALWPRSLFLFLVIWTSQHWILATGLASQTPSAESAPTTGIVRRYLHRLNVRPWAVVLFLISLSLVLLPIFEVEANRETGTYYGDRIFGAFATQLRTSIWVPALLALGFATGFIHYLLDRSVYRMSDPQVRAAASGLIGNVARHSRSKNVSSFALVLVPVFVSVCSLHAQTGTPAAGQQPPKAIYTPRPVYRPEWAKQGLAGKGVVLVTIDQQTGKVTGARMLQSTGNKQLDGAALEAYSQWRFQPGKVAEGIRRSEDIQQKVWTEAETIGQKNPNSIVVGLFVQSLNQMIDLHAARMQAGLRSRIPGAIWLGLFAVAALSLATMGYHAGLSGTRRSLAILAVAVTFSLVIELIADLDRPQEGVLRTSQQALLDVQRSMNPPSP